MPIRAEAFDGTTHEFPDGTPATVIDKAMKAYTQSAKPPDPYANLSLEEIQKRYQQRKFLGSKPEELAAIADAYVRKEQEQGGFGLAVDDTVRSLARGVPVVGGLVDEASAGISSLMGGDYNEALDYQRARDRYMDNNAPVLSTGLQVAGGIAGSIAGARALGLGTGAALPGSTRLMPTIPQALKLGGIGSVVGGADMYGRGEGGVENRAINAGVGAAFGGVLGTAAPYVGGAVSAGAQKVLNFLTSDQALKRLGISREAANVLIRQLSTDDTISATGAQKIAAAGPDGMLVDAGDAAANLLDTSLQRSGPGSTAARDAISQRVARADGQTKDVLDSYLGKPVGAGQRMAEVRTSTAPARSEAYDAAFEVPINYANASGQKLESLFKRIPGEAWGYANKLMKIDGDESLQRILQIADDGTVTLKAMPDMRQMSYVKEALDALAEQGDGTGQLGGQTKMGMKLERLSNLVRDTLAENVPLYRKALDTAAEPAREVAAIKFGKQVMSTATTVDDVVMKLKGATKPEMEAVKKGIRDYIDDVTGRVKALSDDPNVGPEELTRTIRELSSRNSREKLKLVLGDREFRAFYGQMGRFAKAAQLKQAVAKGSQTYLRQATDAQVKAQMEPGVIQSVLDLKPMQAVKKVFEQLSGATPERRLAMEDKLYGEIANALTTVRGKKAEQMLLNLQRAIQARSANQTGARAFGGATTGATFGASQSSVQQAITE